MKYFKWVYALTFLFFASCVPSADIIDSSQDASSIPDLVAEPDFVVMKRSSESQVSISGGVPPYQISVTDDTMGSSFLQAGSSIASIFSKPSNTGNFSAIVRDSAGSKVFVTVDITDGFGILPLNRQVYPGRKIQITPLESDLTSYKFTLVEGSDFATVSETGLLAVSHEAPNNTLISVEVENLITQEKENSNLYVRNRLDSENITLSTGFEHTCLAKTNVSDSSRFLQCWGSRTAGALGEKNGLVSLVPATEVDNTRIITSLATQYPKNLSLASSIGCATYYKGFLNVNKNASSIKCWGNGTGSPNRDAGLYPNTMGTNLNTYNFRGDGDVPLFINKITAGAGFQCALLTTNENNTIGIGSGPNDGEVRCWGDGSRSNGSRRETSWNDVGRLGMNTSIDRNLSQMVGPTESFESFRYALNGVGRNIPNFPWYVHTLTPTFDATQGNISNATYLANSEKIQAKELASGAEHSCVIRSNSVPQNQITCWGKNGNRQVSAGATNHEYGGNMFNNSQSNRITDANNTFNPPVEPAKLFLGNRHSCMIGVNGRLYCWGENAFRQSNTNTSAGTIAPSGSLSPVQFYDVLGDEEFVIAGAAGVDHTCVILNSDINATKGRVFCFGSNNYGQHGIGNFGGSNRRPANGEYVDLGNLSLSGGSSRPYQAVKLVTTNYSTCAMLEKSEGVQGHNIKCWGRNHINQLGYGDLRDRATASDAEGFVVGDGQVSDISSSFAESTCVLKINGNVRCWGNGTSGILGQENFQKGDIDPEEPLQGLPYANLNTFGREIKEIVSNYFSNCVLFSSGASHCFGYNQANGLGVGHGSSLGDGPGELDGIQTYAAGNKVQFKQIVKTQHNGCGIDSEEKVRCWGHSHTGVNANENTSTVSTKMEDSDVILGFSNKKAKKLAGGTDFVCGLFENNLKTQEVFCWGQNYYGQLGKKTNTRWVGRFADDYDNTAPTSFTDHIATPVNLKLGNGDKVLDVKAGGHISCVLVEKADTKEENYVKCWGHPTRIGVLEDPLVLPYSGAQRYEGENFVSSKLDFDGDNPVQIALGNDHACVLFDTEQVKCWGDSNAYGRLGWDAPPAYRRVVAPKGEGYVQLGQGRRATRIFTDNYSFHTCAVLESDLDNDGRYDVKCWGRNHRGQLGLGTAFDTSYGSGYQDLKESNLMRYRIE